MKFYETEDFKNQQKEWYEKLKQSGFEDIEKINAYSSEMHLKITSAFFSKCPPSNMEYVISDEHKLQIYMDTKFDYFQAMQCGVREEFFSNKTHELIIRMKADGMKIKEIVEELHRRDIKPRHRETIRYIIRKYEVRWGVKNYRPSQLSSKREKSGIKKEEDARED